MVNSPNILSVDSVTGSVLDVGSTVKETHMFTGFMELTFE